MVKKVAPVLKSVVPKVVQGAVCGHIQPLGMHKVLDVPLHRGCGLVVPANVVGRRLLSPRVDQLAEQGE